MPKKNERAGKLEPTFAQAEIEAILDSHSAPPEVRARVRAKVRQMEADADRAAAGRPVTMTSADMDKLAARWAALDPSDHASGMRLMEEMRAQQNAPRFSWAATLAKAAFGYGAMGGFIYLLYRFLTG